MARSEGCGALQDVHVPLAMCSGAGHLYLLIERERGVHPYCLTCERFAAFSGEATVNAMTAPGLCHNHILKGRTSEVQILSEKFSSLRLRSMCNTGKQDI